MRTDSSLFLKLNSALFPFFFCVLHLPPCLCLPPFLVCLSAPAAAPAPEPERRVPSPCRTCRDKRPHLTAEHCPLSPSTTSRLSCGGGIGADFDGVCDKTRPPLRLITTPVKNRRKKGRWRWGRRKEERGWNSGLLKASAEASTGRFFSP